MKANSSSCQPLVQAFNFKPMASDLILILLLLLPACCFQSLGHQPSKTHGCAKRGGRPVTWIGGGGLDAK
jgi:hypothetical protein